MRPPEEKEWGGSLWQKTLKVCSDARSICPELPTQRRASHEAKEEESSVRIGAEVTEYIASVRKGLIESPVISSINTGRGAKKKKRQGEASQNKGTTPTD